MIERWVKAEPALALSTHFCPALVREHWLVVAALALDLLEACFELHDERVARLKLSWWGEEAAATLAGNARHPLTQALDSLGADVTTLPPLVRMLLDQLDASNALSLDQQWQHVGELAKQLAALTLSGPTHAWRNARNVSEATNAWTAIILWFHLRALRIPERFGTCALPAQTLAQAQLKRSLLHTPVADHAIAQHHSAIQTKLGECNAGFPALGAFLRVFSDTTVIAIRAPGDVASVRSTIARQGWARIKSLFGAWRAARRAVAAP